MTFENRNESKVDQSKDARSQEAQKSMAQQAWAPQPGKEQKPAGEPKDAQQQINAGLSCVGNLYNSFMHGVQEAGNSIVKGAEGLAQGAVQGAEKVGNAIAQTADTTGKVAQILGSGLEAGAETFVKSVSEDSTVKALGHLGKDMIKAAVKDEQQKEQDMHDLFTDPGKLAQRTVANEGLAVVGVARGIFDFETKLSQQITDTVTDPKQALEKAVTPIAQAAGFAIKTNMDLYTGNLKGLSDDADQIANSAKKTADGVLNGADYFVNANQLERGEVIGKYVVPAVVSGLAGKYVGGKALDAAEKWAGAGEGVGAMANAKKLVGKGLETKKNLDEINEKAAEKFFGKHHETMKGIHEKVEPVESPVHHGLHGSEHAAEHAGEAVEEPIAGAFGAAAAGVAEGVATVAGAESHTKFPSPKLEISQAPDYTLPYRPDRDGRKFETLPLIVHEKEDEPIKFTNTEKLTDKDIKEIERILQTQPKIDAKPKSPEIASTEELMEELKKHDWAQQMIQEMLRYQQAQQYVA